MGQSPEQSFDLLALTFTAGMLDALAYLRGQAFIANMTGNTVLLGLGLLGHHRERTLPSLVSLAAFIAGAGIAALVLIRKSAARHPDSDLRSGVALELAALAVFCAIWFFGDGAGSSLSTFSMLAAGAGALGIQSVAVRRLKIAGVVTTFITGTMTTGVVELLSHEQSSDGRRTSDPLLLAGMFVTYILAAAAGAFFYDTAYRIACFVPLAGAALVLFRRLRSS